MDWGMTAGSSSSGAAAGSGSPVVVGGAPASTLASTSSSIMGSPFTSRHSNKALASWLILRGQGAGTQLYLAVVYQYSSDQ